ncbi:MAG: CinA family protein [Oscillospiraceae bacterium]|jgi:PncC family amidohydrolase|nr:CinA family protein [Oscillospiraceae bacterium]
MNRQILEKTLAQISAAPDTLPHLLIEKLLQTGQKIAVAESCTGGMLSQKITDVSSASKVFDCGVCAYANFIKRDVLNVSENLLQTFGAVSPQTAIAMARGVKKLAFADIGIATTGIAGPGGGTAEKPIGLVYIGVCTEEKAYAIKCLWCKDKSFTREEIRELTTAAAFCYALKEIVGFS